MKKNRKLALPVLFPFFFLINGCFQNFYTTGTKYGLYDTARSALQNKEKYIIAHFKDNKVMALSNIILDNHTINANMGPVFPEHSFYLNPTADSALVYKLKYKLMLNEVHLYMANQQWDGKNRLSIADTSISRVDIYQKNTGASIANHIVSSIGVAVPIILIILAEQAQNDALSGIH